MRLFTLLVLLINSSNSSSSSSSSSNGPARTPSKFRSLRPIPSCTGVYISDEQRISAVFLAPTRLETEQLGADGDDVLLLNILPVPVRSDVDSAIQVAAQPSSSASSAAPARDIITSRDGGFFDELQSVPAFQGSKLPGANRESASPILAFSPTKKAVFDFVDKGRGAKSASPYHAMVEVRAKVCPGQCAPTLLTHIILCTPRSPI